MGCWEGFCFSEEMSRDNQRMKCRIGQAQSGKILHSRDTLSQQRDAALSTSYGNQHYTTSDMRFMSSAWRRQSQVTLLVAHSHMAPAAGFVVTQSLLFKVAVDVGHLSQLALNLVQQLRERQSQAFLLTLEKPEQNKPYISPKTPINSRQRLLKHPETRRPSSTLHLGIKVSRHLSDSLFTWGAFRKVQSVGKTLC